MVQFWIDNSSFFLEGALVTLRLTLLSFALALVIGVVVASFRVSPDPAAGALRVRATCRCSATSR